MIISDQFGKYSGLDLASAVLRSLDHLAYLIFRFTILHKNLQLPGMVLHKNIELSGGKSIIKPIIQIFQ